MTQDKAFLIFEPEILALQIMIEELYQAHLKFLTRLDKIDKILKEAKDEIDRFRREREEL